MTKYQKYKLFIAAIFGALLLLILYNYSSNGRYIFKEDSLLILDTKTGTTYIPIKKEYLDLEGYTKQKINNQNE